MAEVQPRPNSGREIIARLNDDKLGHDQAIILMQSLAPAKAKILGQMKEENFTDRQAVAENNSHLVGYIAYGLIGFFHGLLDATVFTVGELVEITAFGVSRILYRAGDGWNRGRSRLHKGGKP